MKIPYTDGSRNDWKSAWKCWPTNSSTLGWVKSCKLKYLNHITLHLSTCRKHLMLGPMLDKRRQGRQRKQWLDDLKEWTQLMVFAEDRMCVSSRFFTQSPTLVQRVRNLDLTWLDGLIHKMTMTSFAVTLYGQYCRRHIVGQRVVSDVGV